MNCFFNTFCDCYDWILSLLYFDAFIYFHVFFDQTSAVYNLQTECKLAAIVFKEKETKYIPSYYTMENCNITSHDKIKDMIHTIGLLTVQRQLKFRSNSVYTFLESTDDLSFFQTLGFCAHLAVARIYMLLVCIDSAKLRSILLIQFTFVPQCTVYLRLSVDTQAYY